MKKPTLTNSDLELCQTEDNSWTVLHKELDAHYRSMHGAESESEWVFVNGTRLLNQPRWNVVELGFGLGTNLQTVLNVRSTLSNPPPLHYIGLDHQPIPMSVLQALHTDSPHRPWLIELLGQIERGASIARVDIPEQQVRLELHSTDLHTASLPQNWATAFFHDPFGPKTNPESWTLEAFQTIKDCMAQDGVLATYGAAGHARRALASAGFWIASTKGFGQKREMTVASPSQDALNHATLIKKYPAYMAPRP